MRPSGRLVALAVGAAVLALGTPRIARAQSAEDKAAAEALFEDGKRLMRDHHYAEACPKLSESLHLDPGIGTMLWLADCFEKSGRVASAWAEFREAAESAARDHDTREKVARERAGKLEARLPKLTIEVPAAVQVEGLEVKRDGEGVAKPLWSIEVPVDPGEHTVVVSAPRKQPWQRTVKAEEGHSLSVTVQPLVDAPAVVDDTPRPREDKPVPPPTAGRTQRTLGIVVAGVGVVGVGLGAYFGLAAKSKLDDSNANGHCTPDSHCDPIGTQARNDAKSAALLSTIGFVAGGAAIVGGAVLFFTAPKAPRPAVTASPLFLPGGGGLSVRGVF